MPKERDGSLTLQGMSCLFIDGTGGFSPHRLATKPCGGIATSLTLVPRHLAKHGVRVVVASEYTIREEVDGVLYTPTIEDREKSADVVVFNRNIFNKQMERMFPRSRKIWWLHDIVDPRYMEDDSYLQMDKVVALSQYNAECYQDYYGIRSSKFTLIPNGVDKSVFHPGIGIHNSHRFVCASAPIKGLYPLAFTWHNIQRHDPEAELRIYSNQSLHDKENNQQMDAQLQQLADAGAKILDPIPQMELAEILRSARALLMPNHYPEICSNLILQAQACGTPVVTTRIGSAAEFVKHRITGMLTKLVPHEMFWWHKDFAEQTISIQLDDKLYRTIHLNAPQDVKSWDEIGDMWVNLLKEG